MSELHLKEPLFSVLMANYNNGKYLMEAIESVRRQTYTNWEIILVDDESTDDSKELYKELEKDERIHIYLNERNMGCGYTKRRCAELANGEICGFLDPDDALMPNSLDLEVKIHVAHPDVAIIYSKPLFCDTDFNVIDYGAVPTFKKGETYLDHRTHGALNKKKKKNEYYKKTDGINPKLKAGVDQDLYFRMEEVGKFYVLDEFTYKYVIEGHPQAISCGATNKAPLWYWNMAARRDAFIRRGRDEKELEDDLRWFCDNYINEQVQGNSQSVIDRIVERELEDALYKQELQIRNSKPYRLGKALLKPFKWLKGK